jgi:hypothetical protein
MKARLATVDRIVRRLRPDIILPARDPYTEGTRAMGRVPLAWWQEYLRLAAGNAHRVSNRVRVGVAASSFVGADSSLYTWASSAASPIDVVGFSFYPSYDGGGLVERPPARRGQVDATVDKKSLGVRGRWVPGHSRRDEPGACLVGHAVVGNEPRADQGPHRRKRRRTTTW